MQGTVLRQLHDVWRNRRRTMGWVDRYPITLGEAFEQRQLPGAELVLVLLGVLRSDDKQRFLTGERVGEDPVATHLAGIFRQPAGPGRNAAIGIAFFLR